MKIYSLFIMVILPMFFVAMTGSGIASGHPFIYQTDTVRCSRSGDILEKGDTALKIRECMGRPAYIESDMIPAHPFETSEMIAGPELWFYKKDRWTYRITIEDGLVSEILEISP